jgi:hypothetical protein
MPWGLCKRRVAEPAPTAALEPAAITQRRTTIVNDATFATPNPAAPAPAVRPNMIVRKRKRRILPKIPVGAAGTTAPLVLPMIDNSDSESKSDVAWLAEDMSTVSLSRSESENTSDSDASPSKDGCTQSRLSPMRAHVNGGGRDQHISTNHYDVSRRRTKHKRSHFSGSGAVDVDVSEYNSATSISPMTGKKTVTKDMTWDEHRNVKGCLDNMRAHAQRRENSSWQLATAH